MTHRIPAGSMILTPTDARLLYEYAGIGELRSAARIGNPTIYQLLRDISECAFTVAASGTIPGRAPSAQQQWWSTEQVAERAGLAPRTIRLACQRGTIPAMRHGRQWLIADSDATDWLRKHERTSHR